MAKRALQSRMIWSWAVFLFSQSSPMLPLTSWHWMICEFCLDSEYAIITLLLETRVLLGSLGIALYMSWYEEQRASFQSFRLSTDCSWNVAVNYNVIQNVFSPHVALEIELLLCILHRIRYRTSSYMHACIQCNYVYGKVSSILNNWDLIGRSTVHSYWHC